jgi:hypothetical protein
VPPQQQIGVFALGVRPPSPELRIGIRPAPCATGEGGDGAAQCRDAVAREDQQLARAERRRRSAPVRNRLRRSARSRSRRRARRSRGG